MQNCERLFIENINISIISIKKLECYRDKLYNVGIRQAVIRYGTLIPDSNNLKSDAILVSVCDTMAAILAGFVVIPTAFAGGMEVSKGPALLFDVMAGIYGKLPGGRLIGSAFFIGVAFAVLSSLFTFFEISIRTFEEKLKMGRKKGIIVFAIIVLIGNIFVSLGFGPLSNFISKRYVRIPYRLNIFFRLLLHLNYLPLNSFTVVAVASIFLYAVLYAPM